MSIRGDDALGNPSPLYEVVAVEVAHLEAGDEQAAQRVVEVALLDVAAAHGLGQMAVLRATLHVGAGKDGLCRGFGAVLCGVVPAWQEVADGTAVARDEALEAPFVAKDLLLIACLTAAGLAVDALVGTHHLGHLALLHQTLKGGQVGFPEVALGQAFYVEGVAVPLRPAMYGEVLGTGQEFFICRGFRFFRAIRAGQPTPVVGAALQTTYHGEAHLCREVGVFAVGLLAAAPARVTEYVDVGCPERQTLISADVSAALGLLSLNTRFVADSGEDAVQQRVVPRRSHGHGDGKDGGVAIAPYTVQRLVPPLELRYLQPLNGGRRVHHQFHFLVEREARQQVVGPLLGCQSGVLVGQCVVLCCGHQRQQGC